MTRTCAWVAALALAGACTTQGAAPGSLTSVGWGRVLPLGIPRGFETSGAVWHAASGRLVLVSDEGVIALLSPDGGEPRFSEIGGDLEAVTLVDPWGSLAYVGVERPAAIVEVDLAALRVTRRFELEGILTGLEGLAFVPGGGAEGGTFWAGVQKDGRVVELTVPLRGGGPPRKLRAFVPLPGMRDLADLGYDATHGVVLAVYDKADLLVALAPSGEVVGRWTLPGKEQEAVAVLPWGLAVGDDASGEVVLYPTPVLARPR